LFCFEIVLNQSRRAPECRRAPASFVFVGSGRLAPASMSNASAWRGECWPIATLAGPVLILELVYFGYGCAHERAGPPKETPLSRRARTKSGRSSGTTSTTGGPSPRSFAENSTRDVHSHTKMSGRMLRRSSANFGNGWALFSRYQHHSTVSWREIGHCVQFEPSRIRSSPPFNLGDAPTVCGRD
jgi:hypothetical protein